MKKETEKFITVEITKEERKKIIEKDKNAKLANPADWLAIIVHNQTIINEKLDKLLPEDMKKTTYQGSHLEKIKRYFKDLEEAEYIGEYGDMACVAQNEKEAIKKFRKRVLKDEPNPDYLDEFKPENVIIGYLFLADEKNEYDCFVDWSGEKRSDFEVFVLNI